MPAGPIVFGVAALVLLIIGLFNEKKIEGKVALILSVLSIFATIYFSVNPDEDQTNTKVINLGSNPEIGTTNNTINNTTINNTIYNNNQPIDNSSTEDSSQKSTSSSSQYNNNQPMDNSSTADYSQRSASSSSQIISTPGPQDLEAIEAVIVYPKAGSYLDSYETMYVKSEKGFSIYAYDRSQLSRKPDYRIKDIPEKTEVIVIAKENGCSCVIYTNTAGEKKAAWVGSEHLVYVYS